MPHAPQTPPAADPQALPPRTTPTWEMELLLSGATVFALLQAYGWIAPHAADAALMAGLRIAGLLSALLLYLQAAMLALAGGFLVHLLLRAFWISLVGLHSVDPAGGVRNSRSMGPWTRERIGAAWDALPARIAALDDQATMVFAVSLSLARLMALLFLLAAPIVLVSAVVGAASGQLLPEPAVFAVLLLLLLLPFSVAIAADNRAGKRGRDSSPLVRGILGFYDRLGMTPQHNLALQFLMHRLAGGGSRMRGVLGMMAIMLVLMTVTSALPILLRGELGDWVRAGFPRLSIGDHATLRGVHYDDSASGVATRRLPSIPSAVAEGPWLPLFIPWVDLWHAQAFAACTATQGEDWRKQPASARAVLDCMAAEQPLTLDGRPLAAAWHLVDDPQRDRHGFLVMIDLRELAPGAHELTVLPTPAGRSEEQPKRAWRIPFWR